MPWPISVSLQRETCIAHIAHTAFVVSDDIHGSRCHSCTVCPFGHHDACRACCRRGDLRRMLRSGSLPPCHFRSVGTPLHAAVGAVAHRRSGEPRHPLARHSRDCSTSTIGNNGTRPRRTHHSGRRDGNHIYPAAPHTSQLFLHPFDLISTHFAIASGCLQPDCTFVSLILQR